MGITTIWIKEYEKELWHKFVSIAKREGKSASELIMDFVRDYVAKHGEGNPAIPLDKWVENKDYVAFPTLGEPPIKDKLINMPEDMLQHLKRNAEAYASEVTMLLIYKREHEQHRYAGIKVNTCPYCRE
jgi:hypothetical protein